MIEHELLSNPFGDSDTAGEIISSVIYPKRSSLSGNSNSAMATSLLNPNFGFDILDYFTAETSRDIANYLSNIELGEQQANSNSSSLTMSSLESEPFALSFGEIFEPRDERIDEIDDLSHLLQESGLEPFSPWSSSNSGDEFDPIPEYQHALMQTDNFSDVQFTLVNPKSVRIKTEDEDSEDESLWNTEVHVDHNYHIKLEDVKVKVEVPEPEPEPVRVVLPVKRPVGRPRKSASQPKRPAASLEDEIVDVETVQAQVKRPRTSPVKPVAAKKVVPAKRRGRKPNSVESNENSKSPLHYGNGPSCSTDANGFVMRQAKSTAMQKITKRGKKVTPAVSRSKRNDHNDMERRRRHEMRDLFEQLKRQVPPHMLVDKSKKVKKNPSKNTILIGAQNHVTFLQTERSLLRELHKKRSHVINKLERTRKRLNKYRRRHM